MSKSKDNISKAICSNRSYLSPETKQLWIVERAPKSMINGRNYVIKHQHPGRNLHTQAYALSIESAIKKIRKHEEWAMRQKRMQL
jgi:hypothetical protein